MEAFCFVYVRVANLCHWMKLYSYTKQRLLKLLVSWLFICLLNSFYSRQSLTLVLDKRKALRLLAYIPVAGAESDAGLTFPRYLSLDIRLNLSFSGLGYPSWQW
jgi:hypothetical protein